MISAHFVNHLLNRDSGGCAAIVAKGVPLIDEGYPFCENCRRQAIIVCRFFVLDIHTYEQQKVRRALHNRFYCPTALPVLSRRNIPGERDTKGGTISKVHRTPLPIPKRD